MKNKLITIAVVIVTCCTVSCNKTNQSTEETAPPHTNSHRIKRIVTQGVSKEDYQILYNYDKTGKMTYAFVCSAKEEVIQPDPIDDTIIPKPTIKRDTLGYMTKGKNTSGALFLISDYVINIDKDSIARIKAQYPDSYPDTLKKRRTLRNRSQYTSGQTEETEESFIPRTDFGSGTNFNNQYLKETKIVYKYEYDANNRLIVARFMDYKYNPDVKLNDKFEKVTYKTEFSYADKQVTKAELYRLAIDGAESWEKIDTYLYSYSNGELMSIEGTNYRYTRSEKEITILRSGLTEIHTLDEKGYVTKITYADGGVIEFEYEEGDGDFGNLYMTTYQKMFGIPLIK